jgi:hypothetical protein
MRRQTISHSFRRSDESRYVNILAISCYSGFLSLQFFMLTLSENYEKTKEDDFDKYVFYLSFMQS